MGRGGAGKLHFEGKDRYRMESATWTTCPVGNDDWLLRMEDLGLDYVDSIGQARNVRLEYLGVPLLYTPWLDFSLNKNRKTGFITPSVGVSDGRGLEVITPWYWNIAPNRDATFIPRVMTQRGIQIGAEYRYLEPDYRGEAVVEAMPNDAVAGEGRYRGYIDHQHRFNSRLSGRLLLENVSDDSYFTDLANLVNLTSRAILPNEAALTYVGDGWNATGRLQTYQTLQDPAAPIVEPYERLPQIVVNAEKRRLFGSDLRFNLSSELVRFEHDLASKAEGARFYAYPSVEASFERTYGYIRPKLGWHVSRYELERNPDFPDAASATRGLPIVSLDSSLQLERQWQLGQRSFLQTLEPRLYYVNIPAKDQDKLPVFDSSVADLFQSQLFTENQFIGVDRINDANQLTLGFTSRLLEPDSGLERLQVTLGQRYYFEDQTVTMPGYTARSSNATDLLGQISGQVSDRWRIDSGFQYNTDDADLARANFGAAYRAGPGKLVNVDLRYLNENYSSALSQFDLSWQWPIKPGWHSLGRINYSFYDDRLVEGLLGFEYDAGCWSLRGVMQKLATTTQESTQTFFLQLELEGLTQFGPNPLEVLKRSITGYTTNDEFNLP
jgi:LPS-assembly protein